MKLSSSALEYVARGETSSRCESSNRAINKSLPKNRLFSRTSTGRVASAVGRINNSFETFTSMKFNAMQCSLPDKSPGALLIRSYQRKRDLTAKYQRTKEARRRKHALIADKTKQYFEERTRDTNESDYHKYQLDNARAANDAALSAILDVDASTSAKFTKKLEEAHSTAIHLHSTLDRAYSRTIHAMDAKKKARKSRRIAIQKRNQAKTDARLGVSELQQEHSYGVLPL